MIPQRRITNVAIAGAGPVGSFLACLLGTAGLRVRVFESRPAPPERSMAIGIMPGSLRRLAAIGLDIPIVQAGTAVRVAAVHDAGGEIGRLSFASLPAPYDYILTLPQSMLVRILWQYLRALPNVTFETGIRVTHVSSCDSGAVAETAAVEGNRSRRIDCDFLAVCDGTHGPLRRTLGLDTRTRSYGVSFVMGDARDDTGWQNVARLFFTPRGSLESFPLPAGKRRWVALENPNDAQEPAATQLCRRARQIGGIRLREDDILDASRFIPQRRLAARYVMERVALCGDAAHVMSPIGGQGMNVGLADAWHLAAVLCQAPRHGKEIKQSLNAYERDRRRAFRRAARRAAGSMWVGTRCSRSLSALRSWMVRRTLARTATANRLATFFSMDTIPEGRDPVLRAWRERLAGCWCPASDMHKDGDRHAQT